MLLTARHKLISKLFESDFGKISVRVSHCRSQEIDKITHQDVGQMDMYVRMFDELKRNEGDNPTIGIVLCSKTDPNIARYSVLKGNEQLFATKYQLYLPSVKELQDEIEREAALIKLQLDKGDADE
jgi:hypothetical protein